MEEITSRTNERVKHVAALCADAGLRRAQGCCVVDGVKLCGEAARRSRLTQLYATSAALARYEAQIAAMAPPDGVTPVSEAVMEKLSPQRTPQGLVGVARLPRPLTDEELAGARRVLALCGVQDPANVGTAVRTAAAFGFSAVALSADCADLFSPKALRASMGAAFSVGTYGFADGAELAKTLKTDGFLCVATALAENARPLTDIGAADKLALFIGSEGQGLAPEILAACGVCAVIPMRDAVESLNAAAAAAVAMWVLRDDG